MEEIGGLSLPITADFSGLDADFQAAVALAVSQGATLAEAINRALKLPDTTPLHDALALVGNASQAAVGQLGAMGDAMGTAGSAAEQAASQLSLFDEAAQISFADATGQLNMFATELEPLGAAASSAAAGMADFGSAVDAAERPIGSTVVATNELGDAAHHAAEGGHEAHDSWAELGSELAGMVGISLTIEGLIDLAKEALNASDALARTSIALQAITGDGEKAKEILEGLEKLGMEDGLRMPGLREAATQMENMLPVGTDVVAVLGHIADGTAVMGKSIEQGAAAFDRIIESGTLSVKTLNALGIRMDDIKTAMETLGASADEMGKGVKKAFGDLDREGQVAVVTEALSKLDGVAKHIADETFGGSWNRAANQFEADMEGMGKAITPMALEALPAVERAMKAALAAASLVGTGLQVLIDGIVGLTTVALTSIKGLAQAWADAMSGNFKGAIATATQAFDDVKAAAKFSWDSIINDSTKGAQILEKLYASDIPKSTKEASAGITDLTGHFTVAGDAAEKAAGKFATATHAFIDITKLAADGMLGLGTQAGAAWDKFGLLSTSVERSNELLAIQAQRFEAGQISAEQYNKALDNARKIQEEWGKSLDAALKIAKQFGDISLSKFFNDGAIAALNLNIDMAALGVTATAMAPPLDANQRAMFAFGLATNKAKTEVQDLREPVSTLVSELDELAKAAQKSGDWSVVIGAIDAFDKRIQLLSKTDLPEAARQMETWIQGMINAKLPTELVQGQLDKLQVLIQKMAKEGLPEAAAAWTQYLALLNQVPQTIGAILKVQEDQAQQAIKTAEANGTGAENWILKLEAVRLKQEELKIQADGLGRVYVGLIDDVVKGFDNVAKGIADNIIDWKDWGSTLEGLVKNVAKSILETLIAGALLPLKAGLMELIGSLLPGVKLGLDVSAKAAKDLADAAQQAAKSATDMSAAADKVSAALGSGSGTGATGLAGSVSHLTSIISVISEVISAGAAVASTIILSHISSDTGHIEVNTRGSLEEALNLRADLWQQHNTLYDRLGECKNDLDGILDALKNTAAGPGGLPDEAMRDLGTLPEILGAVQDVNSSVVSVLGDLNMVVLGLQNVNSTVYQVHNDLGVMIGQLNTVVTAILYGSKALSQDIGQLGANATAHTSAITGIIGRVGGDIQSAEHQQTNTLGQDLGLVAAATNSVNSSVNNVLHQMVQSDANQGGYVASSTSQIVSAVYGAGSMIANAVGVAIASIGGYNSAPGGGTTQYIPKKTPPTYQQGTESQNPGNSNSPTGNTGQDSGTGAQGGYSVPKHENIPPPITGSTQYAPGSTTQNGGNAPYNPLDPFTWTSSQSPNNPSKGGSSSQPAQYDPYHIPSFDMGGMVPADMLSLVHKDEMVLPPDISQMLRRMAQVPTVGGSPSAFAGAAGGFQGGGGTIINMPVTFNGVTNGRELMDLWTQQVKRIIPRATVFSS